MASGSYNLSNRGGTAIPESDPAKNRPDNTAFTQQRLPAWQPLLSAGTVLPLFLVLGMAFLAIGLGLHFSSENIQELELDYTGAPGSEGISNCSRCANVSAHPAHGPCVCGIRFVLPVDFPAPVCLYYQLSNYYQNNRRYSVSRDNEQLSGDAWALLNPITECEPYQKNGSSVPIAPCGSIANSLFNDTFVLYRNLSDGTLEPVDMDKRGISWWTDTNVMFRNPEPVNKSLALAFKGTAKPPFWPYPAYKLGNVNTSGVGFVNEHFVVWMRTAALPTFRKLYSRIHRGNFSTVLPRGTYYLNITYNYPVLSFNGSKKIILSTLSWMGGKNSFLGITYLVCGTLCVITGVVMLVVHFKFRHLNEED